MLKCNDCGGPCKETSFEIVCTHCGLVNQEDYIVYEQRAPNTLETCNDEFFKQSNRNEQNKDSSVFSQNIFDFPDVVLSTAREIYDDMQSSLSRKGVHKEMIQHASLFFAQGINTYTIRKTKTEFCDKLFFDSKSFDLPLKHFMRACTEVEDYISKTQKWSNILLTRSSGQDTGNQLFHVIHTLNLPISCSEVKEIRLAALKIYDKINDTNVLTGTRDQNILIGIVYHICTKKGFPELKCSIKEAAANWNISVTTLSRISKIIAKAV